MARASRSRGMSGGERPPAGTKESSKNGASRVQWPFGWIGSAVTSVIVAAVTAAVGAWVSGLFSGEKGPSVHSGLPVLIDSVSVAHNHAGIDWAFPHAMKLTAGELADLNRQLDAGAENSWFERRGGVEAGGESLVQIAVSGNASGGARITDITLTKHCQPPLAGTLFNIAPENTQQSVRINFDLDQPVSIARAPSGQDFFTGNTIALRVGEQQIIEVRATTQRAHCSYRLALTVLANGKSVSESVPAASEGFEVTAPASHYGAVYQGTPDGADNIQFVSAAPRSWPGNPK